jgi:hypothetical protein
MEIPWLPLLLHRSDNHNWLWPFHAKHCLGPPFLHVLCSRRNSTWIGHVPIRGRTNQPLHQNYAPKDGWMEPKEGINKADGLAGNGKANQKSAPSLCFILNWMHHNCRCQFLPIPIKFKYFHIPFSAGVFHQLERWSIFDAAYYCMITRIN